MHTVQIFGLVAEIIAVALIGILLDRTLGNLAAALGLGLCLSFLCWLHWSEIKPIFARRDTDPMLTIDVYKELAKLQPILPNGWDRKYPQPTIKFAPAGFISFLGQISVDRWAYMMQENQTQTPLDDVHLTIDGTIPDAESPTTFKEWGSGRSLGNKEIEIGTVRGLLTKGLEERFPIPAEASHIFFYVFMETRLRTYQEQIYVTKVSDSEYEARLEFGFPEKPIYSRKQMLNVATRMPR